MNLRDFQPRRLRAALEQIRTAHPNRAGADELVLQDLVAVIRRQLQQTPTDELRQLGQRLRPVQLRAVLYILGFDDDQDLLKRAGTVASTRQRPDLLRYGWRLLRDHYPVKALEGVVRLYGDNLSWRGLSSDEEGAKRVARWFSAESLEGGVLSEFAEGRETSFDDWLEQVKLDGSVGLGLASWNRALTQAPLNVLERIGHHRLLTRAHESRDSVQRGFAKHYLITLHGERTRWAENVLLWIKDRFGVPRRIAESLTPFWRSIPDETRNIFRRWAIGATLREFFDGINDPHGRFEFWRGFLNEIEDAESYLRGTVAMIDFGNFGVVEFGEKGNAAYVYPGSYLQAIRNRAGARAYNLWQFKYRDSTVKQPGWDGRIIHRSGWQLAYRERIRGLLAAR